MNLADHDGPPAGRVPTGSALVPAIVGLAVLAVLAAMWAARIAVTPHGWLWNADMPKIDYPLAVFAHEALTAGHLPLWNDRLGLGFPLYAEGQVGAFYPPNWILFQLPPITALDATRVLHLAMAGLGSGLLVLRIRGSRTGAMIAVLVAVLGGAITAKLEWHNLVASYAYLPWILLPLLRRPRPTRTGLVTSGLLFGVQALAGHPNTWLLTGVVVAVVLAAGHDGVLAGLRRALGVGLLGAAIGAVQLVPTALLTTLSVRSSSLSPNDLFASAATPFDILAFAFQGAFAPMKNGSWDLGRTWYPDGIFALLEASAYVGLPVLALAVSGSSLRRSRPFVIAIVVLVAIPVIEALRPEILLSVPVLNGLRSPVRAYLPASLLVGVVAGVAVGRPVLLGLHVRRVALGVGVPVAAFAMVLASAILARDAFVSLVHAFTSFGSLDGVAAQYERVLPALLAPWPLAAELAAGVAVVAVAFGAKRSVGVRAVTPPVLVGIVAVPLLLFGPAPNDSRSLDAHDSAGSTFIAAARAASPHRMVTIDPPGWYAGMPDQPAAAGVPDLRMFSSLNLRATEAVTRRAAELTAEAAALRQVLGVDTPVTFNRPCPGTQVSTSAAEKAAFCHDPVALRPPYWIPVAGAAAVSEAAWPGTPGDATLDLQVVADTAIPLAVAIRDEHLMVADVTAVADGWIWVDRAWWPGWLTTVDGAAVEARQALGGQLVPVGAGSHRLVQELVPWDALAGLVLGMLGLSIAVAWARRAPGRSGTRPPTPS